MLINELDPTKEQKCSFCGENNSHAAWLGAAETYCCKSCAISLLPQLMADAVVGGTSLALIQNSEGATNKITNEQEILVRFHSALIRKIRHGKKSA